MGFSCGLVVKTACKNAGSSILAQETPWTEETGGLQSMGSQTAEHNDKVPPHQVDLNCFPYDDIQIYSDARLRSLMHAVVVSTFTS